MHDEGADEERALVEEAAGWLVTLKEAPAGSSVSREFQAWLTRSADHRRAWERVNATWKMLGAGASAGESGKASFSSAPSGIPSSSMPPARRRSLAANRNPQAWAVPEKAVAPRARRPRYRAFAAVAAGLVVAAALAYAVPTALVRMNADHFTVAGEMDSVRLADGTQVDLGGNSAIRIDAAGRERLVTLVAGEAFFDVAHDPARPFVVNARGLQLRVLGTAFDVRTTSTGTTVALLRGSVEVLPTAVQHARRLSPGERLEIDHDTGAVTVSTMSPEDIGAWRQGRVFLTDVSFGAVVEMIQRYHTAWISIPDRSLAAVRVSGLFDLKDPDAALAALVKPFGAKVRSVTPYVLVITRS